MSGYKVLVVEDEAAIRRGIVDALGFAGYQVFEAADGEAGLEQAVSTELDLMLLDLMLPKRDGMSVLVETRRSKPRLPIIILTAKGAEDDRVAGLKQGADDYVVKPFSARELLARVEAVLRRSAERPTEVGLLEFEGRSIDFERREVAFGDGSRSELTEREAEILRYLAASPGRAISRQELLERVWGIDARHLETRTVDMHVARLREKLRDKTEASQVVITVRGKGYMIGAAP